MLMQQFCVISLLILVLSACSKSASTSLPTLTPGAAATPRISLTLPPLYTATVAPVAVSPTPFVSFDVSPNVDGLKLRVGPGYLFDALQLLAGDAVLKVQGKAPGGEWIKVTAADGAQGWVFSDLVKSSVDLQAIPVIEPQGIVVVKGRVVDGAGTPIQGIGFEFRQGDGENVLNNVAFSDADGQFYCFLPVDLSGEWTVTQTAISCKSNLWADSSCSTYKSGYAGQVEPATRNTSVPQVGELVFTAR